MDPSYNNTFGSVDSSDNVLSGASGTTKKKSFFRIGIIAIVVFLLIGGVLLMVFMNSSKNDYKAKFNTFANMVVSGKEGEKKAVSFDSYDEYYLEENYENSDYIKKLNDSFNIFIKSISNNTVASNLPIDDLSERLEYLLQIKELKLIDSDAVKETYTSAGKEAAIKAIESHYASEEKNDEENEQIEENNYFIMLVKSYDIEDNKKLVDGYENSDFTVRRRNVAERITKESISAILNYTEQIYDQLEGKNE